MRAVHFAAVLSTALLSAALTGCNLDNAGDDVPENILYFPNALALSKQSATSPARYLFVANSNFDLRYNSGSLQAYDLEALDDIVSLILRQPVTRRTYDTNTAAKDDTILILEQHLASILAKRTGKSASDASIKAQAAELAEPIVRTCKDGPGRNCQIPIELAFTDEVLIPTHSTGLAMSPDRARLYMINRTDPALSFVKIDSDAKGDDVIRCGEQGTRRCSSAFSSGEPLDNPRNLRFPDEPVSIVVGNANDLIAPDDADQTTIAGDFALVAHRAGAMSLFLPDHGQPVLTDVVTGLPQEPSALTYDAQTRIAYTTVFDRLFPNNAGFKLLNRVGVSLVRSQSASRASGSDVPGLGQSFLYDAGPVLLQGASRVTDTRALVSPTALPGYALVLSREPAALMWVELPNVNADDQVFGASVRRTVEVGAGASRLTLGSLAGHDVVAVSCYDAKQVFIIDVVSGEVLSIIHNLIGPYDLAIDDARKRMYVTDFNASVIRVLDLSPIVSGGLSGSTAATVVATIGTPHVAQELR